METQSLKRQRTRRPLGWLLVLGLVLAGVPLAARRAQADAIVLADGRRIDNVQITRMSWDSVGYTLGGVGQAVEGFLVLAIERPTGLSAALSLIQSGDFAGAEARLKSALDAGQDWEKGYAQYLMGGLYLEWSAADRSKADLAIAAFDAHVKKFEASKDFYLPHATYDLGRAYLAAGKPESAAVLFKKLASYGGTRGVWGYRASIGEALAILTKDGRKNINEVRNKVRSVLDDRKAPQEAREEATIVMAMSYNVGEDYPRARSTIEGAFLKASGKEVAYSANYGRALNLMGDSYRLQGGKENLQLAEIWYLKTTCFFKKSPSVFRAAAQGLAEVYDKLGEKNRAQEWSAKLKT